MKKHFILAAMAATAIFAGCSNENEESLVPSEGAPVNFVIDGPVTRTTTDVTTGITSFVEGDKIAIYSKGLLSDMAGAVFTVSSDGALTADGGVNYTFNGLNGASFYAYYPTIAAGSATSAEFTVATDQSGAGAVDKSDLMTAKNIVDAATTNTISLKFAHRLTLVKVKLTGITASKVEINNVKPTATWTYSTDAVATSGDATTIKMGLNVDEYWAVIPAQTVNIGTILFTITASDGKIYTYTPTVSNITFNEGKAKKFNLAIDSEKQTLVSLNTEMEVAWGKDADESGNIAEYVKNYIPLTNESIASITDRNKLIGGNTPWGFFDAAGGSATNSNGTLTVTTSNTSSSWYNRTLYYYNSETLSPGEYTLSFKAKTTAASKNIQISLVSSTAVEANKYSFCKITPSGKANAYTGCPQTITKAETEYAFTINTDQVVNSASTGGSAVSNFTSNASDISGFFLAIAFQAETFTISDIKLIKK